MSNHPRRQKGARNGDHPGTVDIPAVTDIAAPLADPPLLARGVAVGGGPTGAGEAALVFQFELADGTVTRPVQFTPPPGNEEAELDAVGRLVIHSIIEAKRVLEAGPGQLQAELEEAIDPPLERVTCLGGCGRPIFGELIAVGYCLECQP